MAASAQRVVQHRPGIFAYHSPMLGRVGNLCLFGLGFGGFLAKRPQGYAWWLCAALSLTCLITAAVNAWHNRGLEMAVLSSSKGMRVYRCCRRRQTYPWESVSGVDFDLPEPVIFTSLGPLRVRRELRNGLALATLVWGVVHNEGQPKLPSCETTWSGGRMQYWSPLFLLAWVLAVVITAYMSVVLNGFWPLAVGVYWTGVILVARPAFMIRRLKADMDGLEAAVLGGWVHVPWSEVIDVQPSLGGGRIRTLRGDFQVDVSHPAGRRVLSALAARSQDCQRDHSAPIQRERE